MNLKKTIILILSILFLTSCSTPHVVEQSKIDDNRLTCLQLRQEIKIADNYKKKATKAKGATGKNVAAAIFFWPAVAATYINANEAVGAAKSRKQNLINIGRSKRCW